MSISLAPDCQLLARALGSAPLGHVAAADLPEAPAEPTAAVLGLGWKPDRPGGVPLPYQLPLRGIDDAVLRRPVWDLRLVSRVPPVLNQGPLGSCVAHAVVNVLQYAWEQGAQRPSTAAGGGPSSKLSRESSVESLVPSMSAVGRSTSSAWAPFSRLYLYWHTRLLDGLPLTEDTGGSVRSALESVYYFGTCSETLWPYDPARVFTQPGRTALREAQSRNGRPPYGAARVDEGAPVTLEMESMPQDLGCFKQALSDRYPIIFGTMLYPSQLVDEVMKSGDFPVPDRVRSSPVGGHALSLWGWDDHTRRFLVMNSWGDSVGRAGWFTMPYEVVLDSALSSNFWIVKRYRPTVGLYRAAPPPPLRPPAADAETVQPPVATGGAAAAAAGAEYV